LIEDVNNQTPQIKDRTFWCLFFDLDGTLSDPREGMIRSFQHALKRLGRPVPPESELTPFIGPPLRQTMKKLLATDDPESIERGVNAYREYFGDRGLFENVVYEGIPPLLETLKAEGFPLYVATSKPRAFAERIIRYFGLDRFFLRVFGPEFDGHFDEKSDLLAYVLKTLAVDPARTVMIGDRDCDILAGKRNGGRTIAVTYGFAVPGELEATEPDRTCSEPGEIHPAVLSLVSS
jgi:phosphoglycolate phosphatase